MIITISTIAAIAGWQKRSAIVAIMWKPLFSDRNDHSNQMETSLYRKLLDDQSRNDRLTFLVANVAIVAIIWKPATRTSLMSINH